jgi:hypothetical protein
MPQQTGIEVVRLTVRLMNTTVNGPAQISKDEITLMLAV